MIAWIQRRVQRPDPEESPPDTETPDIERFVRRTRASRAASIDQRKASERVTRQLREHFYEADLLDRLNPQGGTNAERH